ncbi:MAG: S8 family peptidase [Solirubrobacterales bacterium]
MNGTGAPEEIGSQIFGAPDGQRFTQESPVRFEVWFAYGKDPDKRVDLLLTPHQRSSAAKLMSALSQRLGASDDDGEFGLAYNEGYVVAWLDFHQMVRHVLPLSSWWSRVWPTREGAIESQEHGFRPDWFSWLTALVGRIELAREGEELEEEEEGALRRQIEVGTALLQDVEPGPEQQAPLWAVGLNRQARTALSSSRLAVKADAAEQLFSVKCGGLRWAIVDTGVDATHPAFRRRGLDGELAEDPLGATRVVATYDFTRLRPIVSGRLGELLPETRADIERRVQTGRAVDWEVLKPLLSVPHDAAYPQPVQSHGTHIGGIVGGDWRAGDPEMPAQGDLIGICPDIELYDLRVFDAAGRGEEFSIVAALQFVRHLNAHSDMQVIHGVNLSLSVGQDVANFAVGRTPICDEAERLMANGVMVVVAAGNEGQTRYMNASGEQHDGFRTVAITDPGNAERVLTVGSTHRQNPHTYGVSYFSSRGPTGSGAAKPDLVAPGEKIAAPVPGEDFEVKDGTSQATAHVSGIAAMLMARHPELVAQPQRIKEILCTTATDLGRERSFQGSGIVDALRALQAV